jgi:hypothetical protein
MSNLSKVEKDDYEIRTEWKHIQIRTKTSIMEDGKQISYKYSRRVLNPDMDVSGESAEVQALASTLWTDDIKKAWADKQAEEV